MIVRTVLSIISLVVGLAAANAILRFRLDNGAATIKVMTEVVVLPQLKLEEDYHALELPTSLGISVVHFRRSDLLDCLVEIASDSVLTATMKVSLLVCE